MSDAPQGEIAVYRGRVRLGGFSPRGRTYLCTDAAGKKLKPATSRKVAVAIVIANAAKATKH